jgi:hypothetical protein
MPDNQAGRSIFTACIAGHMHNSVRVDIGNGNVCVGHCRPGWIGDGAYDCASCAHLAESANREEKKRETEKQKLIDLQPH